ncbi:MAG: hypothetical protein P1R58_05330 [bacterium]|nr:hypothetical protein [bacterium]
MTFSNLLSFSCASLSELLLESIAVTLDALLASPSVQFPVRIVIVCGG